MNAANLNQCWAGLIMEELARNGVRHVYIAPGSRSTPLVVAAVQHQKMSVMTHYDERGAAFAALGSGRMGNTAAILCTSGTAVANCFPAVAEARQAAIPLVVISADRPLELHNCGANQTMPQQGIFGVHVRADLALPCPTHDVPWEDLLTQLDTLVAAAGTPGKGGPVHLNCMFREPLLADVGQDAVSDPNTAAIRQWRASTAPFTDQAASSRGLSEAHQAEIVAVVRGAERGLLLAGRLYTEKERDAVLRLARRLQWPLFADITSGCRRCGDGIQLISSHDVLLRSENCRAAYSPDVILHLGDTFVSKALLTYLEAMRPVYMQLLERGEVRDPAHRVTHRYHVDIPTGCEQLNTALDEVSPCTVSAAPLSEADRRVQQGISERIDADRQFAGIHVVDAVNSFCDDSSLLFVGNSMPVRILDAICSHCAAFPVHANRGVSGIDGNIATLVGMAHAADRPAVAILGDVTTLHDMNSLGLLTHIKTSLVLVVINNGGGGIFSMLPIAKHPELLGPYFVNRHEWRFASVADMFALPYCAVASKVEMNNALEKTAAEGGPAIIEAIVDETDADQFRMLLRDAVAMTDRLF